MRQCTIYDLPFTIGNSLVHKSAPRTAANSSSPSSQPFARSLSQWTVAGFVINSVMGSAIFGLPAILIALSGGWSTWIVLAGGLINAAIMACFAEVASQFKEHGGAYLYDKVAFGRFVALQAGWLIWLVRVASSAANASLFVIYLGELWPGATGTATRVAIITLLLGSLAIANIIGTRAAASVSTATVIAKVAPLVILVAFVTIKGAEPAVLPSHTGETKNALEAFLLITFLYGGFESGLMSLGEVKNPRRSVVVALAVGLATCALLFTAVQWAVVHTIGAAPSARPVADAASRVLGYPGGIAVSIVALISMYGYLSAQMLNVPRLTYALATGGDFPAFFARIHPRFRTPYSSVALFAIIVWILAVFGTYRYAIGVSSGARIIVYGTVCAALLALRRKFPNAPAFRIPGAPVIGVIAMIVLIAPLTQLKREEVIITAVVIALAAVFWLLTRRRSNTT